MRVGRRTRANAHRAPCRHARVASGTPTVTTPDRRRRGGGSSYRDTRRSPVTSGVLHRLGIPVNGERGSSIDVAKETARLPGRCLVAGLLVYAVVVASGGMRDAIRELRHATGSWLLLALVLEMVSYAIAGWLLNLLRGDERFTGWVTTARVALVMWGLGSLLPVAPAEGIALSASELGRRGVSRQHAVTMLLLAGWLQLWALIITAAVTLPSSPPSRIPTPMTRSVCSWSPVLTAITVTSWRSSGDRSSGSSRRCGPVAAPPPQEDARRAARPASTSTRVCSDCSGAPFIASGSGCPGGPNVRHDCLAAGRASWRWARGGGGGGGGICSGVSHLLGWTPRFFWGGPFFPPRGASPSPAQTERIRRVRPVGLFAHLLLVVDRDAVVDVDDLRDGQLRAAARLRARP